MPLALMRGNYQYSDNLQGENIRMRTNFGLPRRFNPRNKYGAKRTKVDGISFDSRSEAFRHEELKLLVRVGHIAELKPHPRFPLVVNGIVLGSYTADFQYRDLRTGLLVVEDVKSKPTRTRDFLMKKKLMLALHGIEVVEVFVSMPHARR